ncbi:MAG: hypothetical protein P4K97_09560 [Terracidiphilus sp.]|nr:hypothetical protein [Terracidiphilus sp.]
MNESQNHEQPDATQLAAYRRQIARLPITLRPTPNQQLDQWKTLFPFEQRRLKEFLRGIESLQTSELDVLTGPVRALETKMGVEHWNFSTAGDTLENASLLARSASYTEWRREVQRVFEAINAAARNSAPAEPKRARLVLLILPDNLPIDPATAWQQWDRRGRPIKIEGDSRRLFELVMHGLPGTPGMAALLEKQDGADSSSLWLIDAEEMLNSTLAGATPSTLSSLSYAVLKPFRDKFLEATNTIPKNIQGTDQVVAALRRQDWQRWWPAELAGQTRLYNFVMDLFLTGNGALIFSNAFVEWAASEALRRARPRVMVARFGMRSKPKPFTSIAIFENQQRISTLPDVDDPEGSATDALILARYVWLAASRYPEYEQAHCLCVSEYLNSAYLISPQGNAPAWNFDRPVTPDEVCSWLATELAT